MTPAPARLLLRLPNWLGDGVMAFPSVALLRRRLPDTKLVAAVPAGLAPLWVSFPGIDEVVPLPKPRSYAATVPLLRKAKCDAALLFPNSVRSAAETRLAGIGNVAGFGGGKFSPRTLLLHRALPRREFDFDRLHQKWDWLRLAASYLGLPPEEEEAAALAPLPRLHAPPSELPAPGLLVCPGAAYGPAKRWPAERFAETARSLLERHPELAPAVVMGAGGDAPAAAAVAAALPGAVDRAGATPLADFLAAVARARLVLTNDSGAMHLAAALGVPGVALFGSTEPRLTGPVTGPNGDSVRVLRNHVPCSPCFLRTCPLDFACMTRLEVPAVLDACEDVLASSGSSTPSA